MAAGKGTKPNLKRFHDARTKRNLVGMVISVVVVATTYYNTVNLPKKRVYAEFYRTYDAEAAAERMRAAGMFQSMPGDGPSK